MDFSLTAEQKKAEKKMRQAERKVVDAYGKASTKPKKIDDDKLSLIALLAKTVDTVGTDVEIINEQREITFNFHSKKYKIVLSAEFICRFVKFFKLIIIDIVRIVEAHIGNERIFFGTVPDPIKIFFVLYVIPWMKRAVYPPRLSY